MEYKDLLICIIYKRVSSRKLGYRSDGYKILHFMYFFHPVPIRRHKESEREGKQSLNLHENTQSCPGADKKHIKVETF